MIRSLGAQAGFTLLELLAALALSAVGFSVVLNAMAHATRQLTRDERLTQMALTGRTLLDDYSHGRLSPGQRQGTQGDLHWTLTSTLLSRGPSAQLFHLELLLDSQGLYQRFTSLRIQQPPHQGLPL